jgi:MFS family permease
MSVADTKVDRTHLQSDSSSDNDDDDDSEDIEYWPKKVAIQDKPPLFDSDTAELVSFPRDHATATGTADTTGARDIDDHSHYGIEASLSESLSLAVEEASGNNNDCESDNAEFEALLGIDHTIGSGNDSSSEDGHRRIHHVLEHHLSHRPSDPDLQHQLASIPIDDGNTAFSETRLSRREHKIQLAVLAAVLLAESFAQAMIYPYLPFMMLYFYPDMDKTHVGYRAGYIASAFFLGNVMSNIPLGILADRIGRKPIIVFGLIASTICVVLFGLAEDFTTALVIRLLWGALNANLALTKTVLSDITTDESSASSYAVIGLASGLGRVFAPALGGMLAEPAKKYPDSWIGKVTLFQDYPFLLPGLVCASMMTICLILTVCFLRESLPKERRLHHRLMLQRQRQQRKQQQRQQSDGVEMHDRSHLHARQRRARGGAYAQVVDDEPDMDESEYDGHIQSTATRAIAMEMDNEIDDSDDEIELLRVQPSSDEFAAGHAGVIIAESRRDDDDIPVVHEDSTDHEIARRRTLRELVSNRLVLTSISLYGIHSFFGIISNEVLPLFLLNDPADNGFGFESHHIGTLMSIVGPIQMLNQIVGFPRLVSTFGSRRVGMYSTMMFGIMSTMIPITAISVQQEWSTYAQWAILIFVEVTMVLCRVMSFTCIFMFISNSCMKEDRATVNSMAQSLSSIGRAIGPTVGSVLFAWSNTNGLSWPLNFHLVWDMCGIGGLAVALLVYTLPTSIQQKLDS